VAVKTGHIYLDSADEHWRAVDIGSDGWRVIGNPPVRFRRSAGMLPLPVPDRGGSIEALPAIYQGLIDPVLPTRAPFLEVLKNVAINAQRDKLSGVRERGSFWSGFCRGLVRCSTL
jgi:hypothetical protein